MVNLASMKTLIGSAFVLCGFGVAAAGWYLAKRNRAEAHYRGIGGFGFNRGGLLWFVGYLLIICGSSAILVGLILLFL